MTPEVIASRGNTDMMTSVSSQPWTNALIRLAMNVTKKNTNIPIFSPMPSWSLFRSLRIIQGHTNETTERTTCPREILARVICPRRGKINFGRLVHCGSYGRRYRSSREAHVLAFRLSLCVLCREPVPWKNL